MARERLRRYLWLEAIVTSGLPSTRRHVALTLSIHMDQHGRSCYPSLRTIAAETGLGPTAVKDSLNELDRAGYLIRHRGGGEGHPTHYEAAFPEETGRHTTSLSDETGRSAATPGVETGRETGRLTTPDRPPGGPEGSMNRDNSARTRERPTNGTRERANINDAWKRYLDGYGWDDSYTETMVLDDLRRRRERCTGDLTDADALDAWRAARDHRYGTSSPEDDEEPRLASTAGGTE